MPVKEKLKEPSEEELMLYEIVRHPSLFGEFIENIDRPEYDETFEWTDYQVDFNCDFNTHVSLTCGRAVGKTEALSKMFPWAMINNIFPGDYLVYTVPNKVHLEPVWNGLTKQFRTNSFLKNFVEPTRGINSGTNTIKLLNGTILDCRIAGTSGTGVNVIGLHSPFEIVDEGGYYPWGTWSELGPTLNTWTKGYRLIVSGVPTGLRENNVLYHADRENDSFTKHRISAHRNPRYSEEDDERNLKKYGGSDSEDYLHFVLGQHGKPVFSVFDRNLMRISNYPVFKLTLDGIKLSKNFNDYIERLSVLPSIDKEVSSVLIGIDLGYTEPTAIVIMYQDVRGNIKFHARVTLRKVAYPIQSQVIDWLDTKYNPSIIGVDAGNTGKSEIQRLQMEERYRSKHYEERMIPIDFNSNVMLGIDSDGNDIVSRTKPFSVSVLQEYTNSHRIVYTSTDFEMVSELERMTYTKTTSGNIVYRTLTPRGGQKGDDHHTSALLCAMLAFYLRNEQILSIPKRRKLFAPRWSR